MLSLIVRFVALQSVGIDVVHWRQADTRALLVGNVAGLHYSRLGAGDHYKPLPTAGVDGVHDHRCESGFSMISVVWGKSDHQNLATALHDGLLVRCFLSWACSLTQSNQSTLFLLPIRNLAL